jgi:hypothetical protein
MALPRHLPSAVPFILTLVPLMLLTCLPLEYSDMADTNVVDATALAFDLSSNPLICGSLTTTAANDLIVALYNNYTVDSPAGIAPTSGYPIQNCDRGESGQCAAQDGSTYEVGAFATDIATGAGTYTPGFTVPIGAQPALRRRSKQSGREGMYSFPSRAPNSWPQGAEVDVLDVSTEQHGHA